jgi:hypothetical protein
MRGSRRSGCTPVDAMSQRLSLACVRIPSYCRRSCFGAAGAKGRFTASVNLGFHTPHVSNKMNMRTSTFSKPWI